MDVSPRCSRGALSPRNAPAATERRRYSASSKSQVNQLQLARHLPRDALRVIKCTADRGDVGWRQPHRGADKIVITENAVGGVEADPACAGKKNFRPGVKGTFGA